jgi:hypothetical protein
MQIGYSGLERRQSDTGESDTADETKETETKT